MRRVLFTSTVALSFAIGGAACASKGYVNTRVDSVDGRVQSLADAVDEAQGQTQRNAARISDVDQKAGAAQATASNASNAASAAATRAASAESEAKSAGARADAVAAASRRLVYEVVINEDQGNFKFNAVELPEAARARIDELVTQLKADPQGVYFEIEGHTDNTGPADLNERIGLERADAVKRYLYEAHQIPLHRINIISFGEEKPAAPNATREGRAQNRRVVIRVLA